MRVISVKKPKINPSKDKIGPGHRGIGKGRLSIIGIGPGDMGLASSRAIDAIKKSRVIAGYKTYIGLLGKLTRGKQIISTGMTQEIERVRLAINEAMHGKCVALISSGDPGVYAMAGLCFEQLKEDEIGKINIEIIPGIIAATSAASLLGAPLMHDFALISLSDLLTDLKLIRRRVISAAKADFVLVLYNPQSKKRTRPLKIAWDILMKYKSPKTPVGIVRNAARPGQEIIITDLKHMLKTKSIDMVTTIIVGNSQTYTKAGFMITPRGYPRAV